MNENAVREEWLPHVRYYAEHRNTTGLPSLECEFGPGYWKVDGRPCAALESNELRYYVYWRSETGKHHRIGTFDAEIKHHKPSRRSKGALTVGFDQCGRRLMQVTIDGHVKQYRIVAVEWEVVRGVKLPRPIPVQEA